MRRATHIFQTDDEAEFIMHELCSFFGSAFSDVTVYALGDDWIRIEVNIARTPQSDDEATPLMDLDSIFGPSNKGWYECRGNGVSEDGRRFWYEVRHPYV